MKLIVLGPDSANYKGGIAQFTTRLCDEIAKSNEVRHESWYRMYPPFLTSREFRDTVSQEKTGKSISLNELDYLNPFSWFKFIGRVRNFAPDKLVVTWIHPVHSPVYFMILLLVKLLSNTEITLLCHNVLPHESVPLQKPLTRIVFWLADNVIVHGSTETNLAATMIDRSCITQLYHPLFDVLPESAATVSAKKQSSRSLKMLVFGAIRPYKGTSLLLNTIANLKEQGFDLELQIAGEPFDNEHETVLSRIESLGLANIVKTRFGYIPNEDIKPLFESCDVALYPYLSATQSGSLAMAYACGVPVIATEVGGLKDVVSEGVSGYRSPPSEEGLEQAIKKFIDAPIASDTVLQFAEEELSWEKYAGVLTKT